MMSGINNNGKTVIPVNELSNMDNGNATCNVVVSDTTTVTRSNTTETNAHSDDIDSSTGSISEADASALQQQQQQQQHDTPIRSTKTKIQTVVSRAVHTATDNKLVSVVKNRTKIVQQNTTKSVSTVYHNVTDRVRTMKSKGGNKVVTSLHPQDVTNDKDISQNNTEILHNDSISNDARNGINTQVTTETTLPNEDRPNIKRNIPGADQQFELQSAEATTRIVTLSPFIEFITADITLIFIFTFAAALYPIYEYYDILFIPTILTTTTATTTSTQQSITPLFVLTKIALPWIITAFTFGLAIGQYFDDYHTWFLFPSVNSTGTDNSITHPTSNENYSQDRDRFHDDNAFDINRLSHDVISPEQQQIEDETLEVKSSLAKHSLFMSLLGTSRKNNTRIQFRSPATIKNMKKKKTNAFAIPPKVKAWTTLTNKRNTSNNVHTVSTTNTLSSSSVTSTTFMQQPSISFRLPWQKHISPSEDGYLMQHLLNRDSFRRIMKIPSAACTTAAEDATTTTISTSVSEQNDTKVDSVIETKGDGNSSVKDSTQQQQQQQIGSFDLSTSVADTLEDYVITPLFVLRGMDIFLSDIDPEMNASTHPWLIQNGLRTVPTFIVNVLTQWGNIFIYFEMPSWVNSCNVTENENDPDDVKALKRFLNGDTNYRNERLKMIPSLVDGPMPIRMMAPPKREKVVNCDWMPIIWNQHEAEMDANGNALCTVVEATLDCMTSRPIRSMAGLVKKYLQYLSIDVAIVIATPDHQDEVEPTACLGLWRFNHIDISQCPNLPDRYDVEMEANTDKMSTGTTTTTCSDSEDCIENADILRASAALDAICNE